jgi:hypothetical protein
MAFALVLMLSAMAFVLADNQTTNYSGNNTQLIAPAPVIGSLNTNDNFNESASSWNIAWEQLKIMLTFNPEKKAELQLRLADLRLNQAKIAADDNNTEAMQKALDAHDKLITQIQDEIQKMNSANNTNSTRESIVGLVGLERAIQVHEARITRLNKLLSSSNLTADEKAKIEVRITQVQNNTAQLTSIASQKENKLKTKLMEIGNFTEAQAQQAINSLRSSQNMSQLRQNVQAISNETRAQMLKARQAAMQNRSLNRTFIRPMNRSLNRTLALNTSNASS